MLKFLFYIIILFNILISPALAAQQQINWKEQIIYFILIDRFNDGDKTNNFNVDKNDPKGFHGGDIQGIIDKIDYLKSIGVTAIWLSPVFENRENKFYEYSAYHGYWVTDFFKVDKRFGTLEKLKELSDKLHAKGMCLILDMIVNHIDYDSDFVKIHQDWFHSYPSIINWDDLFQLENYKIAGLPDFAQENPEVKKFLIEMSKFWIDKVNPDGFRLDAVKHVPISFWKEYNEEIRNYAGKDFLLIGEILHGDPNYCKKYFNDGKFGSLFDFPLYYTMIEVFANSKSARQLGLRFYDDRKYDHPDMISPILDNHDVPRFITTCHEDINKMKMALATILTARGIPTIYYGTEIALKGGLEPDNRRDMQFNTKSQITDYLKKLTSIRLSSPALKNGLQVHLYQDDNIYSFARVDSNEIAIIILNNADLSQNVSIPLNSLTVFEDGINLQDLMSGTTVKLNNNCIKFTINAKSLALFLYKSGDYTDLIKTKRMELKNPAKKGLVEVTFNLNKVQLNKNENLYIIGGLEELGEWDVKKAIGPMIKADENNFYIKIKIPKGSICEYKYIKKSQNDSKILWQEKKNQYLELYTKNEIGIRDNWD